MLSIAQKKPPVPLGFYIEAGFAWLVVILILSLHALFRAFAVAAFTGLAVLSVHNASLAGYLLAWPIIAAGIYTVISSHEYWDAFITEYKALNAL